MSDPQPSCMPTAGSGVELAVAAVDVRAKRHSVFADAHVPGQTENLESAAVGQDRSVPTHEPMQPARGDEGLQTRSQHEVVGIGEDDLRPGGTDLLRQQRLDRGLGANRHECRGLDHSMSRGHPAAASPAGAIRWQATRTGTAEACHRRLRLRRVARATDVGRSTRQVVECCVHRWDKWTEQPLGGVPLGIGGSGSSAAHAADGILTGRSVCQRRRSRSSRPEARRRGRRTRHRPVGRLSWRPEASRRRFHRACRLVRISLARHLRQLLSLGGSLAQCSRPRGVRPGRRGGRAFLSRAHSPTSSRRQWPSSRTSSSRRARSCRPLRPHPGCPASRV